jgi:ABC-2 type transport system ATP-binding protein
MDEAERCHKLAFIAAGKLLVQGTAAQVAASQNLSTWSIHGEHLAQMSERLQGKPGVDQTVVFGASLHATGRDAAALEKSVTEAAHEAGLKAERIDTGIEDVFIYLMSKPPTTAGSPTS